MRGMDGDRLSYTGGGKKDMDKTNGSYSRDNQILTVERHFSGTVTLHEALKQYISERRRKKQLDTSKTSGSSNAAAAASAKEDGIV